MPQKYKIGDNVCVSGYTNQSVIVDIKLEDKVYFYYLKDVAGFWFSEAVINLLAENNS